MATVYRFKTKKGAVSFFKDSDTVLGRSVYSISGRVLKLVGFNRKKQYCWVIEVDGKQKICKNEMIDWSRDFAA